MNLLKSDYNLDTMQLIDLLILVMVTSSFCGFIYELLFYRIDLGYFVKRGSSYGPWVPIYAFGGLAYALLVYRFKDKPLLVFLLCVIVSGLLEYATGWFLYNICDTRLWDYNTEIWNFGNIGGYVCFRSVFVFGLAGLMLIYVVIPMLVKIMNRFDPALVNKVCLILGAVFAVTNVYSRCFYGAASAHDRTCCGAW